MAVLGLAPHWGFVVIFMRGLRRAGLPPVVRGGVARGLPRPLPVLRRRLHVSVVQY